MTYPEVVQALLQPKLYPDMPAEVKLVQTQMSFVFLAGDYVYKVKKPVNLGFLDYTTLDKRRFFCEQEVALNRRLCPETYLGVVPVVRWAGQIRLGGDGKVIEYAVRMRRLPQERMLNVLLGGGEVPAAMLERVAQKLADFHSKAATSAEISAFGDLAAIKVNTEENFSQTKPYIGRTISATEYRRIRDFTNGFLAENAALFRQRVAGGRIKDCHGDLHAAHICFTDGICIYDCIEFNERFRYCDVASEIAFLAMDLDHYGRADLSRVFVKAYVADSGDSGLVSLLKFYKCYRAYVRGKVEGFKLDDPYISAEEKNRVQAIAAGYFDLARSYVRPRPLLCITVGLVGTGKSTVAQALARRLGLVVISSDITRKQLADVPVTERHFNEFDSGLYSAESTRLTYDRMLSEARDILAEGDSVILDASFLRREDRLNAKKLAEETGVDFFIIECILDEKTTKERLDERVRQGAISDGRWEIYGPQKKRFDPVVEVTEANYVIIDTVLPVDEGIGQILDKLQE
ncbi:MAG: AAA family ATPase [Chloroflexi bacterium]|nr:AAA family ATPase [Chloroflexota bacterium]